MDCKDVCDQLHLEGQCFSYQSDGHPSAAHLFFLLVIDLNVFSLPLMFCSFTMVIPGVWV